MILISLSQEAISKTTCSTVIKACDKALAAKNKTIDSYKAGLDKSKDLLVTLQKDVESKDAQLSAWYRNPILMVLIGATIGVITIGVIKR